MLRKVKHKKIVFTDAVGVAEEYAPKPAIRCIPQWYKDLEPSFPKEKTPSTVFTIKKCIPVLDAMSVGYIIFSHCDVYVSFKDGEPMYESAIYGSVSSHPQKQAYNHPKSNGFVFPKWISPWSIKTPEGYSCLFVSPMHQDNKYFEILEGVVDTDKYINPVNFPFVLKEPKKDFLIPAGTPIAQVIPFKREEWVSSFSKDKETVTKFHYYIASHFFDRYKRMFWSRKSYS